jgi:hypothetical protein
MGCYWNHVEFYSSTRSSRRNRLQNYTMPNTRSRRSQHTTRIEKVIPLLPTVAGTGEHSTVQVLTRGPALHLYSFYLLDCDHDDRGTL